MADAESPTLKLCKDCRFYLGKMDGIYGRCSAPLTVELINLETGVRSPAFTSRDMHGDNYCDAIGRWFEPRAAVSVAAE